MAAIDRLSVRGFKSIRVLEDFELRGLNVLVGANGAGKSNLMSLFRMVSELAAKRLQLFVKREGRADALLFGGRRRTSGLDVELSFNGNSRRYGFSLEPVADGMAFAREHVFSGKIDLVGPPGSAGGEYRGRRLCGLRAAGDAGLAGVSLSRYQ